MRRSSHSRRLISTTPAIRSMPADHFSLEQLIRPNILALHPYRCARDDYQNGILLDANENSYGHSIVSAKKKSINLSTNGTEDQEELNPLVAEHLDTPLHRYPDPSHPQIKTTYAKLRGVSGPENVFLGVGSDEVIDLLFRVSCIPGKDKVLVCPPTYGMYSVCAQINDVGVVKIPQDTTNGRFSIQVDKVSGKLYNKVEPHSPSHYRCWRRRPLILPLSSSSCARRGIRRVQQCPYQ